MPPCVDYFLGPYGSSLSTQKWFSCWYQLLAGQISAKYIYVRGRYLPNRSGGVLINLYLQAVETWLRRRGGGILHIPTQLLAGIAASRTWNPGPVIVTCHDAIAYLPNAYELTGTRYPDTLISRQLAALRRADAILADSEYSRRDIVERLKIDPERVHLVYMGVDTDHYRPRGRSEEIMRDYGFAADCANLLYVGTEAPRKNLEGITRAMAILRDRKVHVRLIKVGAPRPWITGFRSIIQELALEDAIVWHDHVPEDVLPYLYSAADVFVFPSFYEGFGMPVLEAMASGCPVVTSTLTSLPEIAGSAALLVDPYNPNAIADAVEEILADGTLRQDLVRRGLDQAQTFSWNRTAEKTLRIYQYFH